MTVTLGDISQYQIRKESPPGMFDFQKMRAQGVDGVIYRITCQPTISAVYEDKRFMDYVTTNDQVPCAGYYTAMRLERDLTQQFEFAMNVWRKAPPARIWLDLEGVPPGISPGHALFNTVWLLQHFEEATHIKPGIYTRAEWFNRNIEGWSFFQDYPLWLARYKSGIDGPWGDGLYKPRDWDTWTIWQYTDRADGLAHGAQSLQIDKNIYNGDAAMFAAFIGGTSMIRQIKMEVTGAVPNLPCYADNNAPNGAWTMKGSEMFRLQNGEVVITVDLAVLTQAEALRFSNANGYRRVWLVSPDNPEVGVDYDGQELWVEPSHLAVIDGAPPVEPPAPEPETITDARIGAAWRLIWRAQKEA